MDLKLADVIRLDWGKFLEISNGPLMLIFMSKIPQSLLPYSKDTIEKALNVTAQHFESIGNSEAVDVINSTRPFLEFYIDDKEAIESAAEKFGNKDYLKAIIPKLPERQRKLLAELKSRLKKRNKNNF